MNSSTFRCLVESPLGGAGVWKTMVLDPTAAIPDPSKPPAVSAKLLLMGGASVW